MIGKLIWRNLWRNRRRTFITMASIAFAVVFTVFMQSVQKGTFQKLIDNVVSFYSGYVQVHKMGYWDEQVLDNSFVMNDSLVDQIKSNSHVLEVIPRLETFVLASVGNTTKGCMLVGIDPVKENNLTQLKSKLVAGEYLVEGENFALLAEGLAKRLKISVNDTIVLLGQGYQGSFAAGKYKVKGILHFGSPQLNDGLVYLPLASTQNLLSAEYRLTSLALSVDNPENVELIQKEVISLTDKSYEVMTWQEMMPEIAGHIKADEAGDLIFTGILYLIISFGIFGTIIMMTTERRFEFGMLIAIGMKKKSLSAILMGEAFLITVLGTATGILLSIPLVLYFRERPIRFTGEWEKAFQQFGFEAVMPALFDWRIFMNQSITILIIGCIIGLYPLWHVRKLNPLKALSNK